MRFLPGNVLLVAGWVFLRAVQLAAIAGAALFALLVGVETSRSHHPTPDQTRRASR